MTSSVAPTQLSTFCVYLITKIGSHNLDGNRVLGESQLYWEVPCILTHQKQDDQSIRIKSGYRVNQFTPFAYMTHPLDPEGLYPHFSIILKFSTLFNLYFHAPCDNIVLPSL